MTSRSTIRTLVTSDGSLTLHDVERDVTYRSVQGARTESLHVFVDRCLHAARAGSPFRVLELGFGGGTNFGHTYVRAKERGLRLDYVSVELAPVPTELLVVEDEDALELARHAVTAPGVAARDGCASLTVLACDWSEAAPSPEFDAVYHDPFGPGDDPACWGEATFRWSRELARDDAILATYSSAGHVRRALAAAGWAPTKVPGPGRKREVTFATAVPR